jgi:hypothetical protein
MKLREMDEHVTYRQQLQEDTGPIVLINQFNVAPEDGDRFLEVWADGRLHEATARLHLDPTPPRHSRKHNLHQRGRLGIGTSAR